jgi:hypothetical protein
MFEVDPETRSLTPPNSWARQAPRGWGDLYRAHRDHASFRAHTWPVTREYGFSCSCCGETEEWRATISEIRRYHRSVVDQFVQDTRRTGLIGNKTRKRAAARASIKAKALLYHQLTREQKWELRATNGFTVTGGDGKRYRITKASTSNVKLVENGVDTQSLCVVFKDSLPVYDLLLAQKFMLECDPDAFWKIAKVTDLMPMNRMRDTALNARREEAVAAFLATG